MIKIIIDGKEVEFKGDELTSPTHDAIAFLQQELEKEMEF
jgi:hypothetical protein